MKKRFKNILAKKRKKNGMAVLICAILLAVSFGILVGCSITKENTEDNSSSLETEDSNETESVNIDESAANQQESSRQTAESINPETFPVGEYHDDMGSQLIISKVDDKNYTVEFGIYKSMYTENAVGSYDVNTGILSFSGTDISTESTISADVAIQGDNLLVTLTHSEHLTGETFEFEPGQP